MVFGVEVVKIESWQRKRRDEIYKLLNKYRLATAITLDVIDLVFGNIPFLNTIWDFVTCGVLLITLKNKYLAFFALGELLFPGIGFWSKEIDAFIPSATILYFVDKEMGKFKIIKHPFHKEFVIKKK
ncbi:hypothetical protein HN695_02585 [Candidatus Woesearchaeota archaeon]|jgi:hypothetical protein|nr:hypothetical protein [Candidatus Woesearchaeota archaeon]MBT5272972.1 hypothetical protein [Candidatus Woesearchaeota archaeon]MBT6041438.1 hypothetical protein [Candidatus Woesearchaeota archaeon]MBT6337321.1 hypothetical protein [Candidatus Woesearchaeota archaeon]MBT7927198.1 hypothetical protein [Candidatus Woesearchaeota archaeon]